MKSHKMQSLKKLLDVGNLYIFFYVFSTFKHSNYFGQVHWIVLLPISLICSVFLYLVFIISAIYYEIVNLVLKLKHGDAYCGIMDGSDTVWCIEEETNSIIKTLFMIDAKDGEDCEPIFEFIKKSYRNMCRTHEKMTCVRRYSMGYWYFAKTDININEYVKYLDDYKDVEGLNMLIDKLSDSPLSAGNTALWEAYIGRVALKWEKNGGKVQYPIFIKYHHSLCDGFSLISLMTTQLFENGVNTMKENCETYGKLLKKAALKNSKPTFLENLKKLYNKTYITYFGLLDDNDENMLQGKILSHEKNVCYALEKETTNYVEKVKSIKNRIKGIAFNDVIMTAVSASFAEYYMAHDKNPPEKIRFTLPYYIASANFNSVVSTGNNGEIIANLKNNFTLGFLNVPMKDKDIGSHMVDRLLRVNKDFQLSKDSLDFQYTFWQLKVIMSLLPFPMTEKVAKANRNTVILTNLPGSKTATLLTGHRIRDAVVWAPNFCKTGIGYSVFTYEGLFRFGLMVDKEIIKEKSQVQQICDNIFKYIDLLDVMTRSYKEI